MNKRKEILQNWMEVFTSLKVYGQNKLYKIIGPFIVGIELIKLPRVEEYRPHFVIYPLYGNNLGTDLLSCLKYPIVMHQFYNKMGLQFNIPYNSQNSEHLDAIVSAQKESILNCNNDVKIGSIFKIIEFQLKDKMNIIRLAQPDLFKIKFYAALYLNDKESMSTILKEILEDSKSWNMEYFLNDYGNFNDWYKQLQSTNRNNFMNIIAKNKEDKKISMLLSFELVKND